MLSLLFVTWPTQQNARLKYLSSAKQQIISSLPLLGSDSAGQTESVMTFAALPQSIFLSSIIQTLEAKLEAVEVQMRYSLLAVGMPQDCGCVSMATK
jgi:hypothetical protein